jgi:hypothetical protein
VHRAGRRAVAGRAAGTFEVERRGDLEPRRTRFDDGPGVGPAVGIGFAALRLPADRIVGFADGRCETRPSHDPRGALLGSCVETGAERVDALKRGQGRGPACVAGSEAV